MFSEAFLSVIFGLSRNGTDIFAIVNVCVEFCACLSVTIETQMMSDQPSKQPAISEPISEIF
jgi:hypothetical protein